MVLAITTPIAVTVCYSTSAWTALIRIGSIASKYSSVHGCCVVAMGPCGARSSKPKLLLHEKKFMERAWSDVSDVHELWATKFMDRARSTATACCMDVAL